MHVEVVSKPHIRPNGRVVHWLIDRGKMPLPLKIRNVGVASSHEQYARFSIRVTPCLDAHFNLLKSRRVIPRSSGKPDLRF